LYNPSEVLEIVKDLRPTFRMRDVGSVNPEFLMAWGIELVIWDIDGTLMNYHDTEIASEFRDKVRRLFEKGPGRHCILSNCDEVRYPELGKIFPEIPVLRGYHSPEGPILRVLEGARDSHSEAQVKEILKNGKVLRKPSGKLIELAMNHAGVVGKQNVMMVGDQYLTDIASGNMGGVLTAKVPAFGRTSFPMKLRVSQRLEQALFHLRHIFSENKTRNI
jgi:predicted HAD superfamily phosphohydrolase YqeG